MCLMKAELGISLKADFSPLYDRLDFGFECGDGWYELLRNLSQKLFDGCAEREIHLGPEENGHGFYATQVKEKYGTLRFYTSVIYDWMGPCIENAEFLSGRTCEYCGEAGEIRHIRGWYITRCEDCTRRAEK